MSDAIDATITVWPECSKCGTAWVLRRGLSLSRPPRWYWQRDCKHGREKPEAVLVDANGRVKMAEK